MYATNFAKNKAIANSKTPGMPNARQNECFWHPLCWFSSKNGLDEPSPCLGAEPKLVTSSDTEWNLIKIDKLEKLNKLVLEFDKNFENFENNWIN